MSTLTFGVALLRDAFPSVHGKSFNRGPTLELTVASALQPSMSQRPRFRSSSSRRKVSGLPSGRRVSLFRSLTGRTIGIVSVLYWGMTAYDPTLLVPPGMTFQIPLSLDIGLHALPALYLWFVPSKAHYLSRE